jgi:N-carbamoylputrescine amidase
MAKKSANQVRVGLVQMSCDLKPQANLKKAIAGIHQAAKQGAQVVCLQELFRSQYFCQTEDIQLFKLAETIPGPTTDSLARIARQNKIVIVASLFEKRAAGIYHNTAVTIDANGRLAGKYRKMHIPDDPLYYEKFYFTPGDLGFRTHDTAVGKIGTLVCWDQWFPEAARLTALSGAQFLSILLRSAGCRTSRKR